MRASNTAGRHELCDNQKCIAYQTNLADYATQHVAKECNCKEFHIDLSKLNAVLKTGVTPLLRICEAETLNELTVDIVASEQESCYLALSHVWADGLGNTKANALPRCQLLRLGKLTESLKARLSPEKPQSELLIWFDTLCCPIAPEEAKHQVLAQMRNIYEQATCVLVLDASLQFYESENMGPEETCARIFLSGWMRRLWTLQEGTLPAAKKRLWFQFRDQALNLHSLRQQVANIFNNDWSRRGMATDILGRMRIFLTFFQNDMGADLAMVDRAFRHRSVSVPSDEPLLIGTLLGLDVAGI